MNIPSTPGISSPPVVSTLVMNNTKRTNTMIKNQQDNKMRQGALDKLNMICGNDAVCLAYRRRHSNTIYFVGLNTAAGIKIVMGDPYKLMQDVQKRKLKVDLGTVIHHSKLFDIPTNTLMRMVRDYHLYLSENIDRLSISKYLNNAEGKAKISLYDFILKNTIEYAVDSDADLISPSRMYNKMKSKGASLKALVSIYNAFISSDKDGSIELNKFSSQHYPAIECLKIALNFHYQRALAALAADFWMSQRGTDSPLIYIFAKSHIVDYLSAMSVRKNQLQGLYHFIEHSKISCREVTPEEASRLIPADEVRWKGKTNLEGIGKRYEPLEVSIRKHIVRNNYPVRFIEIDVNGLQPV